MVSSSESSEEEDFEKFAIITDIVNSGEIPRDQNNSISEIYFLFNFFHRGR